MKFSCRHAVAALALFCCIHAWASPYPTERQLRTAIGGVAEMLKSEGLELDTSAWLHEIIAADLGEAAKQNLFATAFQLRRHYLPRQ